MFYQDKQGVKWELRNVAVSEVIPDFIHADGGESGQRLNLHVGEVRLAVVNEEREAKA
jgi:hypothetical protein